MKKYLVLALLVLALPVYIFAKTAYPDYKNYVNDFSGTLSQGTVDSLNQKLSEYNKATTNQIAVAMVTDLQGIPVEQYSIELAEKWQVGNKGKDNGAILVFGMTERKIRIEVGYGLEGDLTDAEAAAISRNIISPDFKAGKYDDGVTKGIDAVIAQLGGADSSEVGSLKTGPGGGLSFLGAFGDFFWIIFIIPTWLFSLMARSKSWYAGGIFGGIIGVIVAIFTKSVLNLLFWGGPLIIFGFLLDYFVSKKYYQYKDAGMDIPWFWGGGGFGGGSGSTGGFGGFGGGGFGGGGGGGDW